jgi:hypothetical protein
VTPEDVINVKATSSTTRVASGSRRNNAGTPTALITYTVNFHDNTFKETYSSVTSALKDAASSGTMDDLLQSFAVTFSAPGLEIGSVDPPATTSEETPRPKSKLLSGPQIAGLIIGIFVALGLLAVVVVFALNTPAPAAESPAEVSNQA